MKQEKKETLAEVTAGIKRLELEIKRQELRNKLDDLKKKGVIFLLEPSICPKEREKIKDIIDSSIKSVGNKPSFLANLIKK